MKRETQAYLALVILTAVLLALLRVALPAPTEQQALPATLRKPVPAIYQLFDWGTDFRTQHPEWGAIGSVQMVQWYQINPAPGVFNWSLPDSNLAKESGLTVVLNDGTVVQKPVCIEVTVSLAKNTYWECSGAMFFDGTPGWVYDRIDAANPGNPRPVVCGRKAGYAIQAPSGCTGQAVIPMYDNAVWRSAFAAMVQALGDHYRDNPQIQAVFIMTGLDGETQVAKDWLCKWIDAVRAQMPHMEAQFTEFCGLAMGAYRKAFPNTPVYIMNAPGGTDIRVYTADKATTFSPPVGIKHNGLWIDWDNHEGYGNIVGSWDPYRTYSMTLPIWIESVFGAGSQEQTYWSYLAGLHYHPDGIDLHPGWAANSRPEWLDFVRDHLARTVADTPDVWTALRDTEHPIYRWTYGGQSGHLGDWAFWLNRLDNAPGNMTVVIKREALPAACQDQVYSRQARRTDQASGNTMMSFDIADAYASGRPLWHIEVTLLNVGGDTLSLQYVNRSGQVDTRTVQKGPALGPVDRFVTVAFDLADAQMANGLPGGADFRLNGNGDGNETVHFVRAVGSYDGPPPPTRTPAPTVTPGPSATGRPTATPAPTSGAAPTPTPIPGAQVVTTGRDTYISAWVPDSSYSREPWIAVRMGDIINGLLAFDVPPGPVAEARLCLYAGKRSNAGGMAIMVAPLLRAWSESATWTWAQTVAAWAIPGALGASDSGAAILSLDASCEACWLCGDVTALARQWAANPASNFGLLLRGSGTTQVQYSLASLDYADPALRPQLVVRYATTPTATSSPAPTTTATLTRTLTPTEAPTLTLTPSLTAAPTATETATALPTATPTATAVATSTPTPAPAVIVVPVDGLPSEGVEALRLLFLAIVALVSWLMKR